MQKTEAETIDLAVNGDMEALESLLIGVKDMIFNLSLRMLGSPSDAEDAMQEIMIKIITKLSTFRKESAFSTWVYRIAMNYLINYQKSMFAKRPLSFEYYAEDINAGFIPNTADILQQVDEEVLAEELKASCTNVMLQCLDPKSRCIYVLGLMFKADSRICGEILGMSPEAYRQRLSRIRKKMAAFLNEYCNLFGSEKCSCRKRVGYAIITHGLNPKHLEYSNLETCEEDRVSQFIDAMEEMDRLSDEFAQLPIYHSPFDTKKFLKELLQSNSMSTIQKG